MANSKKDANDIGDIVSSALVECRTEAFQEGYRRGQKKGSDGAVERVLEALKISAEGVDYDKMEADMNKD
jgi:hypothetical protein